jgi:hypothetical protein
MLSWRRGEVEPEHPFPDFSTKCDAVRSLTRRDGNICSNLLHLVRRPSRDRPTAGGYKPIKTLTSCVCGMEIAITPTQSKEAVLSAWTQRG